MLILAIETATPEGGVALWRDGEIVANREEPSPLSHSLRLMPGVRDVLEDGKCALKDLDAFAVSIGPGSFTGLRIGLSVAKTLSLAAEKPIVAVPTLEALALRFAHPNILLVPMLDARRKQVYATVFECDSNGSLRRLTPDLAIQPEKLVSRIDKPCIAGGLGAKRYADFFAERLGENIEFAAPEASRASACSVAQVGAVLFLRGETANLLTLEPAYVRKSDAELARERRREL